jgi:Fe2+ or Zn2+ uptake regulation protein
MTTDLERTLHESGLKVTSGRLAVLQALESMPHSDADTLHRRIAIDKPGISVQSVHNILGALTSARVIRRIEPSGSPARYERRIDDNHHHIVCTSCGAIADVDCVVGHAPCLSPSDAAGYAVATAEVTFWGLCSACQTP